MKLGRALDSCYLAAYIMVDGKPRANVSAANFMMLTFMAYGVDIVAALNLIGMIPLFGLGGHALVILECLPCGGFGFSYLFRSSKILEKERTPPAEYRVFRYIFFCAPITIFLFLIFMTIS